MRNFIHRSPITDHPSPITHPSTPFALLPVCLLVLATQLPSAALAPKLPVVSKWGRFDHAFTSSIAYSNPVQQATLSVTFNSPLGETHQVYGFWDGGKTWRVRFSPDQPGRWTFKATCSDAANRGLHQQTGEFMCSAPAGTNRFQQHGPVRVAQDRRHLEHADGTPFFWLADTVWNGACVSDSRDWQFYAHTRAAQKFTVAQWNAASAEDIKKQMAFTGRETIAINPDFFKRLDAKLETLSRAGLLSAIAPLMETDAAAAGGAPLTDDQAGLLVRYVVARWGAEPVAWLLRLEGERMEEQAKLWKKIGQEVFGQGQHAPVILYAGGTSPLLDPFRDEMWVDGFGFQSVLDLSDDALKSALEGPLANEWKQTPARPLIAFAPYENGLGLRSLKRFEADDVRRAVYWSLMMAAPAGISYGGQGVVDWDTKGGDLKPKGLPLWQRALFMPAAKEMAHLARFAESIDFWRLQPQPGFIPNQPGNLSARRYLAAAGTEGKDLSLVYVPEDRTIEVLMSALPSAPSVNWLNPRTGENSPAVAVVSDRTCQFPTPDPGDWLLVLKAGK